MGCCVVLWGGLVCGSAQASCLTENGNKEGVKDG